MLNYVSIQNKSIQNLNQGCQLGCDTADMASSPYGVIWDLAILDRYGFKDMQT